MALCRRWYQPWRPRCMNTSVCVCMCVWLPVEKGGNAGCQVPCFHWSICACRRVCWGERCVCVCVYVYEWVNVIMSVLAWMRRAREIEQRTVTWPNIAHNLHTNTAKWIVHPLTVCLSVCLSHSLSLSPSLSPSLSGFVLHIVLCVCLCMCVRVCVYMCELTNLQ